MEQAGIKLPCFWVLLQLMEGTHADEQTATTNAELEDEAEFVVTLDVVDNLYYRTVLGRGVVEYERMGILQDGEPLPRGVFLGGELAEYGMLRIRKNTEGSWRYRLLVVLRDSFEHAVVPVIGLE